MKKTQKPKARKPVIVLVEVGYDKDSLYHVVTRNFLKYIQSTGEDPCMVLGQEVTPRSVLLVEAQSWSVVKEHCKADGLRIVDVLGIVGS